MADTAAGSGGVMATARREGLSRATEKRALEGRATSLADRLAGYARAWGQVRNSFDSEAGPLPLALVAAPRSVSEAPDLSGKRRFEFSLNLPSERQQDVVEVAYRFFDIDGQDLQGRDIRYGHIVSNKRTDDYRVIVDGKGIPTDVFITVRSRGGMTTLIPFRVPTIE